MLKLEAQMIQGIIRIKSAGADLAAGAHLMIAESSDWDRAIVE